MRDFQLPGRSPVLAKNGMCATSHPLAVKTALNILERGGNAMDAAIAGAVLLGICEPQMTGIGGDCFVLYSPAGSDEVHALNGSGRAPKGLDASILRNAGEKTVPLQSAYAVTVPGAIDAFCHLSENLGKLGLDTILAPAIHYADEGVPVAPRVSFDWNNDAGTLQGKARDFFLIDGKAPQVGSIFRAPGQAEVLRRSQKRVARVSMKGLWPRIWSTRYAPWAAPTRSTILPTQRVSGWSLSPAPIAGPNWLSCRQTDPVQPRCCC